MNKAVYSPVEGNYVPLNAVADPVFKEEILGPTLCLMPEQDIVYAPFDGTVSALYPTGHAVGLTREDGLELLIHIGIDTVALGGHYFESRVRLNDHVKAGQELIHFSRKQIEQKGFCSQVFILYTNSTDFHIDRDLAGPFFTKKDVIGYAEKI